MFGWILQKNPVDSDTSIVAVPLSPPASSRSTLSSSSVNVCGAESSFVTVTSVGPDTVIVDGWNVKPWITISFSPPVEPNGRGYYEARSASDHSAYTCPADGLHRRQDAVARPVRRGRPYRTVHRLYGVHRRLSVPRARLRERRTRAVAGRRPGRVHSRRSRLRHLHPGVSS